MTDRSLAGSRLDLQGVDGRGADARQKADRSSTAADLTASAKRVGLKWSAIRGFREVVLIAAVYTLYDLTRYFVAGAHNAAFRHGRTLLHFEQRIGVDPEHALNRVFSAHIVLALPSDYIYATLHYVVTPIVLVWMWRRHGGAYSSARTTLMLATVLGLVGFSLLPTAPPRMLPGFIDTMAKFAHYGWWGAHASAPRGFGGDTNEYAALPSLHVGWAVWCGWQLVHHGRHRVTRWIGVAYPVVLAVVVMATANHYLIDVLAGLVVIAFAGAITQGFTQLAWRVWPRRAASPQATTARSSPSNSSPPAPV